MPYFFMFPNVHECRRVIIMERFGRLAKKASDYFGYVAGVFIAINMALVVYSVVARIFFRAPIAGLTDLVGFASGISALFAFAYTQKEDSFIKVDFVGEYFPQKVQLILQLLFAVLEVALFALVSYRFFVYGISTYANGNVTWVMYLPYYPIAFIGCLGMAMLTLMMLVQSVERIKTLKGDISK